MLSRKKENIKLQKENNIYVELKYIPFAYTFIFIIYIGRDDYKDTYFINEFVSLIRIIELRNIQRNMECEI